MNQKVTKSHDRAQVGYSLAPTGIEFVELIKRLANNLKLSFDGRAQHPVGGVVVKNFTVDEFEYRCSRFASIPEKGAGITLHNRSLTPVVIYPLFSFS